MVNEDISLCYDDTSICYDGTLLCYDDTLYLYDNILLYGAGAYPGFSSRRVKGLLDVGQKFKKARKSHYISFLSGNSQRFFFMRRVQPEIFFLLKNYIICTTHIYLRETVQPGTVFGVGSICRGRRVRAFYKNSRNPTNNISQCI